MKECVMGKISKIRELNKYVMVGLSYRPVYLEGGLGIEDYRKQKDYIHFHGLFYCYNFI